MKKSRILVFSPEGSLLYGWHHPEPKKSTTFVEVRGIGVLTFLGYLDYKYHLDLAKELFDSIATLQELEISVFYDDLTDNLERISFSVDLDEEDTQELVKFQSIYNEVEKVSEISEFPRVAIQSYPR